MGRIRIPKAENINKYEHDKKYVMKQQENTVSSLVFIVNAFTRKSFFLKS